MKARQQPAEQEPENVDRDSESEKGEEKGTVDSMYDQCVTFSNLKEVRVIHRLAKGSVSPGHQWPVGGALVLSRGLTPLETQRRNLVPDKIPSPGPGWQRDYTIGKTNMWDIVCRTRSGHANRALGQSRSTATPR